MTIVVIVLLLLVVALAGGLVALFAWSQDRYQHISADFRNLTERYSKLAADHSTIEERYRPALQQSEQTSRHLASELARVTSEYNRLLQAYQKIQQQHETLLTNVRSRYGRIVDLDQEVIAIRQDISRLTNDHDNRIAALDEQYELHRANLNRDRARLESEIVSAIEALQRQRDSESQRLQAEINRAYSDYQIYVAEVNSRRGEVASDYERMKGVFERLTREVARVEESLEDISYGLYKPHYDFDTSEGFRRELDRVRDQKKNMVRGGAATRCLVEWTVGGSRRDGERMQQQLAKLMLRAFNGETDAAIANVRWNNVTKMEDRLDRAYEAINKLGTVVQVAVVPEYVALAIQEIRLEYEHEEKRHAEQEEQRQIKARMREEERAQRELRKAEQDAVADEHRYEKALERARAEIAKAKGEELVELNQRIIELQAELAEAHARHERAVSMAQLTRCGYVYITSNMGSFGIDMLKLGMTRRLDPMDRIWELSDASVPFDFDVHGMIYCEDAPALEQALHRFFDERRVNLVNCRKEFFRVTVDEIQEFLNDRELKVELTKLAEAREYRETLAIHAKRKATVEVEVACVEPFPEQLE